MVGQQDGIYDVFIGINNGPCMTLPSSLHILDTFGHFNFVFLLLLHETVPLKLFVMLFELHTGGHS